ncbi:hypothetical protein [Azohydromonas australica]|uniref:hypothetical protein n=1 Tax=Azohydromonas australica TaxID=364039 RepID=UPI00048A451E|nr:hypothetical protein [Azohydromonas australica]
MTNFMSMTHVIRSQVEPYLRLAWFILEAAEREHRLNVSAMLATPGALVNAQLRIAALAMPPWATGPSRFAEARKIPSFSSKGTEHG